MKHNTIIIILAILALGLFIYDSMESQGARERVIESYQ